MKYFKYSIALLVCIILLACGNEKNSAEKRAAIESLSGSIDTLSKSLARANTKHDESYYKSELVRIIKECVDEDDSDNCVKKKINLLRN